MSAIDWAGVREALGALVEVCEAEQRAVVTLDADTVTRLTPRKRQIVTRFGEEFGVQLASQSVWPDDVRTLALRCRRLNHMNHQLLSLTVRRMEALVKEIAAPPETPYDAPAPARRGRIDSRV